MRGEEVWEEGVGRGGVRTCAAATVRHGVRGIGGLEVWHRFYVDDMCSGL
jgi:hypothetical protein